jgi:hypothetical protein
MALIITSVIAAKIERPDHGSLTRKEIEQCFENHCSGYCTDDREEHRTDPPTLWFVGETNQRRRLKVVFIQRDDDVVLKSAYPATQEIERIFHKYSSR